MRDWPVKFLVLGLLLFGFFLFWSGGPEVVPVPGKPVFHRNGEGKPQGRPGPLDPSRSGRKRYPVVSPGTVGGSPPRLPLVVQVLDGKGGPLHGVPVGLYSKDPPGKRVYQSSLEERRITDSRGEAIFQDALSFILDFRRKKLEVHAGLAVFLEKDRFQTVRLDEGVLRKKPPQIVLRTPGLGWMKVHSPAGSPIPGSENLLFSLVPASLQVSSNWRGRRRWVFLEEWSFPLKGGIARIPVGLGLELEVWTLFPGLPPWREKKIQGPEAAGQVVDVFLDPWNLSICAARAVDEKGGILSGRDLHVFLPRVRGPLLLDRDVLTRRWLRVKTDEKGVFRFPLPLRFKQFSNGKEKNEGFLQVLFQTVPGKDGERGGPPLRAVAQVPEARTEEFFLGDVRFHPPWHWVGVQLSGPGGRPVPGGKVTLALSAKVDSRSAVFRKVTDRNGACRFPVYSKEGIFRVSVSREGFWNARSDPRPLAEPEERVRLALKPLRLPEGGRIAYQVLLDKAVLLTPVFPKIILKAVQTWPGKKSYGLGDVMNSLYLERTSGILSPGVYRVEVRLWRYRDPILCVDGIRVEKGKTTKDPRLNPLDLRPLVKALSLEIVPPGNWMGRVYGPEVFLVREGPGRYGCLLPAGRAGKVLLRGPGIHDQWVDASSPRVKVVLRKGLPLRIRLEGEIPPLPSWVKIVSRVMPTCRLMYYMGDPFFRDLGRYLEEWRTTGGLGEFDGKGECHLLVGGPGKRRIQFFLVGRKPGGRVRCLLLKDQVFSLPEGGAAPQALEVSLDPRKILQVSRRWKGE